MGEYTAKKRWFEDYREAMLLAVAPVVASGEPLATIPECADRIAERIANQLRQKRQELGVD